MCPLSAPERGRGEPQCGNGPARGPRTDRRRVTIHRDAEVPSGSDAPAEPPAAAPAPGAAPAPAAAPPASPATVPAAAAPAARRRRKVSIRVLAFSLALLLCLGVTAFAWREKRSADQISEARRTVTAVAQTYAINLTTYDHATLERDFARVLDNSTGSFKSQYTLASEALRSLIAKYRAVATGKVLEIAVTHVDTRRATVLLFVDQTVNNANTKEPRIDRSRMKMGLEKSGDRWLINSLDLI
jgi:Mce-associated membrane protein